MVDLTLNFQSQKRKNLIKNDSSESESDLAN